eukprot:Hpha_TRINITY_DN15805_c0_g5::TRINITY_DN15805_c0_g5_i1::g.190173::m.190173
MMGRHAQLVVRFSTIWEDFADLQWQFELYNGDVATRYHLLATSDGYKVERFFPPTERSYRLVGLQPGALVKVSVRPQFQDEWGEWSTATAQLHSTCALRVGQVGADFIHGLFDWGGGKEDTPTHIWSRASKFQLKVRQKEHVLASSVCDLELEREQREIVVKGLKPGCIFGVQIRAVSTTGDVGHWCDEVRFLTLADVVVMVREVGEDYGVVWWGRDPGEPHGVSSSGSDAAIEQFALRLELVPDERTRLSDPEAAPTVVDEQTFGSETCVYTMRSLVSGRSYDLWARHLNIQGDWSPWRRSRFRTMDRVGMVNVVGASHNFLHLSWEQETQEAEDVDLPTNSHVVSWQVRCVNTVTRAESAVVLPAHETTTRIINLPDSTEFELAVRAKTGFGEWGPWGQPAFAATLPPLSVALEAAGENWLSVSWARVEKKHDDGISRYHLQLSAADTPFRLSKYFPPDVTEFKFNDLTPGKLYYAAIQACVSDRWQSWSDPTPVRTASPAEALLVRRGEDFVQIRWTSDYYTLNQTDPLDQRFQLQVVRLPDQHLLQGGESEAELVSQELTNVFGYRVAKLAAGSRVGCRVRAFDATNDRWGQWSEQLCVTTLPSVITFTMIAETCAEVAWQRRPRIVSAVLDQVPVDDDPLAPTEAVMFILRINEIDQDGVSTVLQKCHFTDQDKPFYIVEGLCPNSTYSAQLCTADSNQAWSPWSAETVMTTVPPLRLKVEDLGEDYCTLQWEREPVRAGGSACQAQLDETDTKYRVVATPVVRGEDGGAEPGGQLNYTIEGDRRYTIRHLAPATSYRLSISAYPRQTNIWGVWSKPVYVRTNDPIEVELEAVGEDYAHISWRRLQAPPTNLEELHAGCDVTQVGPTGGSENPAVKRMTDAAHANAEERAAAGKEERSVLHLADYAITEFDVKVFRIDEHSDPAHQIETRKTLEYERFVANDRDTLRIPQLRPNTQYEAIVCACNRGGEWGVWSNALPFCTTMPTEIIVADIRQECIQVRWGRGAASATSAESAVQADTEETAKIVRYQLKIVGHDDDLCKEVLLSGTTHEYDIHGLGVNCCYAVTVRCLLADEDDWGQWCNPVFVALRTLKVSLVETSQDWLKVNWQNKPVPDGRLKKLFITLIGDHRAVTITLPTGGETEYAFSDLSPLTVYSLHLLCVEHVPTYIRAGGAMPGGANTGTAPLIPEGGRPTDAGITVALPLVAADYSNFYTGGAAFSTLANIAMEVMKVGENFVTVRWGREVHAHGAAEAAREREATYDISCRAVGGEDSTSPRSQSVQGTEVTLNGLRFNTLYELQVRKVSLLTSAWSKPATVQTLDRVKVTVGPSGASADPEQQVGVGEDFILLNWEKGLSAQISHAQHAHFEVQCVALGAECEPEGEPMIVTTAALQYKLTDLEADTRYKVNVRSVISDDGTPRAGEWCDDIILATLAPMAVRIVAVTEETSVVEWMRRGEDPSRPKAVHTIGSYHVKVFALPRPRSSKKKGNAEGGEEGAEEQSGAPAVLMERQLLEDDIEFGTRRLALTGLKPSHSYTAIVRASTENTWGAWSPGVTFTTQPRIHLTISLVGEEAAFLLWTRQGDRVAARDVGSSLGDSVELAPLVSCELAVSTVGRDAAHSTRMLPAEPNRHRLCGLVPNMPYSLRVRPCYPGSQGPWSAVQYFVTLAPMRVDVSRIGETFVHVQWHRLQQQRIADRLREQHRQQQEDFEREQLELEKGIEAARGDDGSFDKQFLSQLDPSVAATGREEESQRMEELLRIQREQQQKQRQLRKLQELQMLDLERETRYPDGHERRYEVVISATSPPQDINSGALSPKSGDGDDAEGSEANNQPGGEGKKAKGKNQPFSFRRRINVREGEDCRACKMDGLQPKTTYTVTVRAMYSNGLSVIGLVPDSEVFAEKDVALLSTEEREHRRQEAGEQLLWGAWSGKAELVTLKQISLSVRGIGSAHCVVDWDTGFSKGDAETAVSQYQLMVAERDVKKGGKGTRPCQDLTLDNPNLESWTIVGLQPSMQYTVSVRVYYEDDRCGMWSPGINFLTLPALSARVQSVGETKVEVLVWREVQRQEEQGLMIWRPPQSELQLSINEQPSPSTFKLDLDQSTLLSLDDLTIDSEYKVRVREVDANSEWREWQDVVRFETLPSAPSKPQLDERRGRAISISWQQRKGIEMADYLYSVEMAYLAPGQRAKSLSAEHGPFARVGLLRDTLIRLEPGEPVHNCLFRVKVCKLQQRIDSAQQAEEEEEPYLWSQYSPVAHFGAPSVPQPPSQLKIVNLRDTSATVKWRRPENWKQHTNLVYKVYLSNSYHERPVCLGSTSRTSFRMEDLVPNTHYRVGITAESSMGVSQNNHVLHFSTRVLPHQGPMYGISDNPSSSTLPPRTGILMPRAAKEEIAKAGSPSARSDVYSLAGSPGALSTFNDGRSSAVPSPQRYGGPMSGTMGSRSTLASRKGLPQRPATTVPPACGDMGADDVNPPRSASVEPSGKQPPGPPL